MIEDKNIHIYGLKISQILNDIARTCGLQFYITCKEEKNDLKSNEPFIIGLYDIDDNIPHTLKCSLDLPLYGINDEIYKGIIQLYESYIEKTAKYQNNYNESLDDIKDKYPDLSYIINDVKLDITKMNHMKQNVLSNLIRVFNSIHRSTITKNIEKYYKNN